MADFIDLVKKIISEAHYTIKVSLPAKIETYDHTTQKASVKIDLEEIASDGSSIDYPIVKNVPIMFLSSGGASITMPVKKGDHCLLIFCDRDISNWKLGSNRTETKRTHNLTDAIAIVGLQTLVTKSPAENNTDMLIKYDQSLVRFRPGGILDIEVAKEINIKTTDVNLIAQGNIKVECKTASLKATGDVSVECQNAKLKASGDVSTECQNSKLKASGDVIVECQNAKVNASSRIDTTAPTFKHEGNAEITGTLKITGAVTAENTVTIQGAVSAQSSMSVQGASSLQGAITAGSTISAQGAIDTSSTVTATNGTFGGVSFVSHKHTYDRPTQASVPMPTSTPI